MKKQRKHYTPEEKVAIRSRRRPRSAPSGGYVERYNNVRLNSAIGYIKPKDMLAGRRQEIQAERDRKLEAVRKQRQIRRQHAA
jgi:hypothetical protein